MKCPVCSADASAGAQFCPQCGAKLGASGGSRESATAGSATANPAATMGRRRAVADVPEATLWEGRYSPKAMLGTFLFCDAITLALIVGGILSANWIIPGVAILVLWSLIACVFAVRRLGIHYKLTNHMFYHTRGVLTRTIDRIEVINIDDVEWKQTLFDRLVNVGTIIIFSPLDRTTNREKSSQGELSVPGIDNVATVAQLIDKARRDERIRRGFLTIEQTDATA